MIKWIKEMLGIASLEEKKVLSDEVLRQVEPLAEKILEDYEDKNNNVTDNNCDHDWVSADNEVVTGVLICTKCSTITGNSQE